MNGKCIYTQRKDITSIFLNSGNGKRITTSWSRDKVRGVCDEAKMIEPSQSFTFMTHIMFYLASRILRNQDGGIK